MKHCSLVVEEWGEGRSEDEEEVLEKLVKEMRWWRWWGWRKNGKRGRRDGLKNRRWEQGGCCESKLEEKVNILGGDGELEVVEKKVRQRGGGEVSQEVMRWRRFGTFNNPILTINKISTTSLFQTPPQCFVFSLSSASHCRAPCSDLPSKFACYTAQ